MKAIIALAGEIVGEVLTDVSKLLIKRARRDAENLSKQLDDLKTPLNEEDMTKETKAWIKASKWRNQGFGAKTGQLIGKLNEPLYLANIKILVLEIKERGDSYRLREKVSSK